MLDLRTVSSKERDLGDPHQIPQYNNGSVNGSQKSPSQSYALRLSEYYCKKYGKSVAPIAMLKTLAVISAIFRNNVKLWVLNVAPSRQLKSKTTEEQMELFPKSKLVYVGSDFTIHGLIKNYGDKINNKCLVINDLTLLLASKAERTKARLIDALSELASEGHYIYSDNQNRFEIKAKFSLLTNITPSSFFRNRAGLLGNTFTERCLVVYHELTESDMSDANLHRAERSAQTIEKCRVSLTEDDVNVNREDERRFDEVARLWRILGSYTSSSSLFDMIKSLAIAYAMLAGHREITGEEFEFLSQIQPYICNWFEPMKLKILELAYKGFTVTQICKMLSKDSKKYHSFVSRTVNDYRRQGVLPPPTLEGAAVSKESST